MLAALLLATAAPTAPARAQAIKGEVTVNTSGGYGRLVFRTDEDVETTVRTSGAVLIITFKKPVDIAVDRLNTNAPDYVSAARRDPDGTGIRLALARKFTVNSMAAGERLFIDLLPDTWTGLPPGLPREVVAELARRAREAERKIRQQQRRAEQQKLPSVRVRMATHPTFTRYVFPLPELIPVASDRSRDKLTLTFDAPIKFDLADVKADLPPRVGNVDSDIEQGTTQVRFAFSGKVDVRFFREDNNYVVDVSALEQRGEAGEPPTADAAARVAEAATKLMPAASERTETAPAKAEVPAAAVPALPAKAETPRASAAEAKETTPKAVPPPAPGSAAREDPKPPAGPLPPAASKEIAAAPAAAPPPATPIAAPAAPSAAAPETPAAAVPREAGTVKVAVNRQSDGLRLTFPFGEPVASAAFARADTLWLVFDTQAPIEVARISAENSRAVRGATVGRVGDAQVVRIKLERPQLVSLASDGPTWTATIGDAVTDPSRPLGISRNIVGSGRSSITIPFDEPRQLHRLPDPEVGDTLLVVTALAPSRGFLKSQDFVEFRALSSSHGVVIQPLADDLTAELAADKIVVTRPSGLTLSPPAQTRRRAAVGQALVFDTQLWGFDRQADFGERQAKLMQAAADAPENRRTPVRLELARFYLARDLFAEAKAVLDVTLADERRTAEDPVTLVLHAIANIMLDRPEEGLKDLANPVIGNQYDAPLWRALAHARQGKWAEAREGFKNVEMSMAALPVELQRITLKDAIRASIEVRDFAGAAAQLSEFETIGVAADLAPTIAILNGRLAEGLGRSEEALAAYRSAAESKDRRAAAQGRLRETALRFALGDLKNREVIADLEQLTTIWRGDDTEIEALAMLAHLYTGEGRYRDAFQVMRTALAAHPDSEMTRRIQDEAASTFDAIYLGPKGDALPAIDALSLFYDFRELTPIGRRGDEMIRRLSDRLVSVDLLDQAAELLQHQVDHRLQGAARAQVAVRLAVVYLMNAKPDRALATLRATRTADLSNELRNQRLLLESRALSDTSRHDLALEVIANIEGREADRLRADVLWAARRWREAAEQIELMYGDRWRQWQPLTEPERADVLRAAVGYALAEDAIGLGRFREKYAPKMADGANRRAFDIASAPASGSGAEFRDVARAIASIDTLDGFLRDMRARYPDTGAMGAVPAASADAPARPQASNGTAKPDPAPTGSIRRRAARR